MAIIFYDIPYSAPSSAWSPNTWKVRYILNYKGIPYETKWLEYPDIENYCKTHGIPPAGQWTDGRPQYTLPAIYDPSTGKYVSDSFQIAQYLEKTYPNTPHIFPDNTIGLQEAFTSVYAAETSVIRSFILPLMPKILNPVSSEYFNRTREITFGKKLEDVLPSGESKEVEQTKYKRGFTKISGWYERASDKGPFILGANPSWTDFFVAGNIIWFRTAWGRESQEWKDFASLDGGRWEKLLNSLKQYETIH